MDEAARADRVVVMEAGEIVMQGTPRESSGELMN
jgi:ABC-type glutathione transport system ATPase component